MVISVLVSGVAAVRPLVGVGHREHPRGCGEQGQACVTVVQWTGTSPQAGGAELELNRGGCPAREHPRGCGERLPETSPLCEEPGTSPRAARSRAGASASRSLWREHPAGAGSRQACRSTRCPPREHPCRRGEHAQTRVPSTAGSEISPRMRGAGPRGDGDGVGLGNIPAGAGSSRRLIGRSRAIRGHPRRRGEQLDWKTASSARKRTSLRVRGAAHRLKCPDRRRRSIPAGAGSRTP